MKRVDREANLKEMLHFDDANKSVNKGASLESIDLIKPNATLI